MPGSGQIKRVRLRLNGKNRLVQSPVGHRIERLEEAADVVEIFVSLLG